MGCSRASQKICLSSFGTVLLLLALSLSLIWKKFALDDILYPRLKLNPGTLNYDNWIETPDSIELYLEIFMFNWTNSDQVHNHSVKPHFVELGPYVFRERHFRTNITWNNNATVTFNQIRRWNFDETKSNGTLKDEITNLNVIAATVAYSTRYFPFIKKDLIGKTMRLLDTNIIITKTVGELLFEGYEDDLLDVVRLDNDPTLPKIPFERFGWFVDRNNSWEYDGNFTMFTGDNDIFQLGNLEMWKFNKDIGIFRGDCDKVQGTTGELWPPIREGVKPPLTVFATDICRPVTVKYESDYSKFGVKGYKWVADDQVFDNGRKYPQMACYCTADNTSCPDLLPGVYNASVCKFGAPAFVSFPHFYLADKSYASKIEGMNPNKEKHEFFVSMEPRTGIPLDIRAQLQINIHLSNYPWTPITDVAEAMIPMFWLRQSASLSEELASQAKLAVMLPDIGSWIAYGFIGISVILFSVLIYCCVFRWRRLEEDEEPLQ